MKPPIRLTALAIATSCVQTLLISTIQAQDRVPRLIVFQANGSYPDLESGDSHALIVESFSDAQAAIPFGPQSFAVIKQALVDKLGGETSAELISELAEFVSASLDSKYYRPRSAKHIQTGGPEIGTLHLSEPEDRRLVALTGAAGDAIVLGEFEIELIDPSNSWWAECDDDPNNNYCGTWTVRTSTSPVQTKQICLAIAYFRN